MNVGNAAEFLEGTPGPYRNLEDYILGITHEIWESRQVERIRDYYSHDCTIYTLGGIIRGADTVVRNTHETLAAFPDRLVLGDAVIASRDAPGEFYSSHRVFSPMTNLGPSPFGPATGKRVVVRTMADCVVENGVITTEWLVRDNHGLVKQLGLDPLAIAARNAKLPPQPEHDAWLESENARVQTASGPGTGCIDYADDQVREFAESVLRNGWATGDSRGFARHYAPYAVLHDSRPVASGLPAIRSHFNGLRNAFEYLALSVDHVCVQPYDKDSRNVAVRWTLVARHRGDAWGAPASGRKVLILGVTHWRIVAGRVASEWTIFDRIAVLTQIYR